MTKRAIFPGTFDPITYGHIDLIKRASKIFEEVIVAVANTSPKATLFDFEERVDMVRHAVKNIKGVRVESFRGLVIDYVKKKKTNVIIRGLRMISDFEYEFQMALTNRKLSSSIETIFMMPSESYSYISSRLLKEAASLGADLKDFIPSFIIKKLKSKLKASR
jgi:pantetheine-phosphate adenylyltransferase